MRPRVRHEIESGQGGYPAPKEISVGVWITAAIIIAALIWIL